MGKRLVFFFSSLLFNLHAGVKLFLLFFPQCSILSNFSFFCDRHWFLVVKVSHEFLAIPLLHMSLFDFSIDTDIFGQFNLLGDLRD